MNPKTHRTPYSNIHIVILAHRGSMVREVFGGKIETGLLNIANKPLLTHVLERLGNLGFDNITLVCVESEQEKYKEFMSKLELPIGRFVNIFPVNGEKTTGEIIRMLPRNTHMLLYPIDLITTVDLTSFVDFHIQQKSPLTVFATKYSLSEKLLKSSPGLVQSFQSYGKQYFVYDEADPTKLITLLSDEMSIQNDIDLNLKRNQALTGEDEDETHTIEITPENLMACHSMIIDNELKLTNAYLISPESLEFLKSNPTIHSIENEFLPKICTQFTARIFTDSPTDFTMRIHHYIVLYNINILCANSQLGEFLPEGVKTLIEGTQQHYYKKGEQKLPESLKMTAGSLYGENVEVDVDSKVVRSVLGKNSHIGKNVKLMNAVIGDNVKIGDNSVIMNSMICYDSVIPAGSELTQCFVVPNYVATEPVVEKESILKPH